MTTKQTTFENDNIAVTLKRDPGCRVRLDVVVTPKAAEASHKKAIAMVRKEISIPGFRKGKAPEDMIHKNYAPHIEREWKDILLNASLDEAIRLVKIYPFNKNSVKSASIKSASLENGATITYEYEAAPEIPVIDPSALSIPKVDRKAVTEKDITHTIEDLRLQSAEWNDVTDRPLQEGDYAILNIDDLGNQDRSICKETLFAVAKDKMGPWMLRLILGMTPGQSAEGMSEKETHDPSCNSCDDSSHSHDDNFVPTKCRITLQKIRHPKLHPLDDALAKKYGADNTEQLKERVKASLEKRSEEEQKDAQRLLMEAAIFQKYPFDMPFSLLKGEIAGAKNAFIQNLKSQGISDSEIAKEAKEFEVEVAKKYDRDFRLYFITQKAAREHQIAVDKSEVMAEMMRQLWLQQSGKGSFNLNGDPKEVESQLQMQLLAAKVLDFFVQKAAAN